MCALVFFGVLVGGFIRKGIYYDNPTLSSGNRAQIFAEKVSKLVSLPEGETPTVATVSNPEVLQNQAFFAEAKSGDIVLIYSKKAVLYDPLVNKVIIVAPVNLGTAKEPAELLPKFQGEKINIDDPNVKNEF